MPVLDIVHHLFITVNQFAKIYIELDSWHCRVVK